MSDKLQFVAKLRQAKEPLAKVWVKHESIDWYKATSVKIKVRSVRQSVNLERVAERLLSAHA